MAATPAAALGWRGAPAASGRPEDECMAQLSEIYNQRILEL
jgi:hypothetical protein